MSNINFDDHWSNFKIFWFHSSCLAMYNKHYGERKRSSVYNGISWIPKSSLKILNFPKKLSEQRKFQVFLQKLKCLFLKIVSIEKYCDLFYSLFTYFFRAAWWSYVRCSSFGIKPMYTSVPSWLEKFLQYWL